MSAQREIMGETYMQGNLMRRRRVGGAGGLVMQPDGSVARVGGAVKTVGSRVQVWNGTAEKTKGGLTVDALGLNKRGELVSVRKHELGLANAHHIENSEFYGRVGELRGAARGRAAGGRARAGARAAAAAPASPRAGARKPAARSRQAAAPAQDYYEDMARLGGAVGGAAPGYAAYGPYGARPTSPSQWAAPAGYGGFAPMGYVPFPQATSPFPMR
jgi:hypothetical protein